MAICLSGLKIALLLAQAAFDIAMVVYLVTQKEDK